MLKPRYCKNCGSMDIKFNKDMVLCRDCGFVGLLSTNCELGCNLQTADKIIKAVVRTPKKIYADTPIGEIRISLN